MLAVPVLPVVEEEEEEEVDFVAGFLGISFFHDARGDGFVPVPSLTTGAAAAAPPRSRNDPQPRILLG